MKLYGNSDQNGPNRGINGGFFSRNSQPNKDPVFNFLYRIKYDINYYFKLIGFDPTWQQKELIDAFVEGHANIAVRSGKGP